MAVDNSKKVTSKKVASKSGELLSDKSKDKDVKSVAASALSQTPNKPAKGKKK